MAPWNAEGQNLAGSVTNESEHHDEKEPHAMTRERTLRLVTDEYDNVRQPETKSLTSEGTTSRPPQFLSTALHVGVALLLVAASVYFLRPPQSETITPQSGPIGQTVHAETAVVTARELFHKIEMAGNLDYGDGQLVQITSKLGPRGSMDSMDRGTKASLGIFFREEREIRAQLKRWHRRKLERLGPKLMELHRALLANSQAAEMLLSQGLVEIARFAARR